MERYIQTIKRTTLKKMKDQYTSPSEFSSDFSESYKKYWDEHKKIEDKIKQLQEEKEQLFYPRLEEQLQKIAPEIQKALKADAFKVSRHGGLSNRTSLWFTKGKPKKNDRFSNTVGYLCFGEYNNGEVALVSNIQDDQVIDIKSLTLVELVKFAKENI